jgi:hypothetical protein
MTVPLALIIPANAGIHGGQRSAGCAVVTVTPSMGPGVRRDDEGEAAAA